MACAQEQWIQRPLAIVVSGEARRHEDVLRKLLGPNLLNMYNARGPGELVTIVQSRGPDVAVVDSDQGQEELLWTLRLIRRVNRVLPVILVVREVTRRFMEDALRLTAFSIAQKPLEREELLIQLRLILKRYYGY